MPEQSALVPFAAAKPSTRRRLTAQLFEDLVRLTMNRGQRAGRLEFTRRHPAVDLSPERVDHAIRRTECASLTIYQHRLLERTARLLTEQRVSRCRQLVDAAGPATAATYLAEEYGVPADSFTAALLLETALDPDWRAKAAATALHACCGTLTAVGYAWCADRQDAWLALVAGPSPPPHGRDDLRRLLQNLSEPACSGGGPPLPSMSEDVRVGAACLPLGNPAPVRSR